MLFGEFLLSSDLLSQFGLMLLKSTAGVYKSRVPARGPLLGFSVGSASQILVWRAVPPSGGLSKAAGKWSPCPLPSLADRSNMAPTAGSASGGWLDIAFLLSCIGSRLLRWTLASPGWLPWGTSHHSGQMALSPKFLLNCVGFHATRVMPYYDHVFIWSPTRCCVLQEGVTELHFWFS